MQKGEKNGPPGVNNARLFYSQPRQPPCVWYCQPPPPPIYVSHHFCQVTSTLASFSRVCMSTFKPNVQIWLLCRLVFLKTMYLCQYFVCVGVPKDFALACAKNYLLSCSKTLPGICYLCHRYILFPSLSFTLKDSNFTLIGVMIMSMYLIVL